MGLFSFFDGIIDAFIPAVIETAGEFIIGGPSGQQQQATQRQPVSKVAEGSVATSRVSRPDVPDPPETVDVDTFHAEWMARMSKFSELAAATNTGQIRRS